MTTKIYHNDIVNQLQEWVRSDKENFPSGETYKTFEDAPDLRDRITKGKLPIDLRYSIDLIHVEEKEEERDERDPEKGKAKVVYYYTLFLVTTGDMSGVEKSEISGISDLHRKRLLFYQYYFSSISEPKYIRVIFVIPFDVDVSQEAKDKLFEEYKIGLWKVNVKNKIKCEEIKAEFVRERMENAFKKSTGESFDLGLAIKKITEEIQKGLDEKTPISETLIRQTIENRAEDFTTFFEQYVLEAIDAIVGITPEHIGKRYIDRALIDETLKLGNLGCIESCRDHINEHLDRKIDDYIFCGQCFEKLWYETFKMHFPTMEDYEKFLQKFFPHYREHFVHQFQVFLFGLIILDSLLENPTLLFEGNGIDTKKNNLLKGWLLASSIHDFTYPLQEYDKWGGEFYKQQLAIESPPRFLDLGSIYVEKTFHSRVELLLSLLVKDMTAFDLLGRTKILNEIRRFFYFEIAEKKNHGLMGSCYLLKTFEGKSNEEISDIVLPAAVASTIHEDEMWHILSGQVEIDPPIKEWEYIRDKLDIPSSGSIEKIFKSEVPKEEKGENVCKKLKEDHGDWTGNVFLDIYNIIEKKPLSTISLRTQPLAFLLILCDNLQDCERPCENPKDKAIMDALDIRLKEVIPEIQSKKITIRMQFNDVEEGSEWRSYKIKTFRKLENFLKSPDMEFKIEYLDRETNTLKIHSNIH